MVLLSAVEIEIEGEAAGLWVAIDISRQRELEEQVRQAANLEVAGRVAAGLAHDFNNLLTVMLGQAELMMIQVDAGSPLHQGAAEIKTAALSAASLTSQLLAIGGRQPLTPKTVNLRDLLTDISGLVVAALGKSIAYSADLPDDLWAIHTDPVQLERVLMNLAVNAKDAMPSGGSVAITCSNVIAEESTAAGNPASDEFVELRIRDNGPGMDSETLSHIFEPFYTTKGTGTGLGLATVHGIVTQSGGQVSVSSVLEEGTEFRLRFPRHRPDSGEAQP